jgi:hypothetical protein
MVQAVLQRLDKARLQPVSSAALTRGLAATPMDQYVIWDGGGYDARRGSMCFRMLGLIGEFWTPVQLRDLVLRAARIEGSAGILADVVRDGLRQHQRAKGARYLLVRKTALGDYVAVTDLPRPGSYPCPVPRGAPVLTRSGQRFSSGT